MRRRTLGTLSGTFVLLVAAATGLWGGAASASSTCTGNCALGELELTGPPLVASPSVGAGTTSSLTFTLTNDTTTTYDHDWWLPLGSAELTAPSGFTLDSASLPAAYRGWATVQVTSGTTLDVDHLDLWPGQSISVVLSVTASCAASSGSWALAAHPSWFAPEPWHAFTVDPSSALAVGVTGACTLAFTADPASAVVSTDITSQLFTPSGSPVEVEAKDAGGNPLGGVDVSLSAEMGAGTLAGTTASDTGVSGLAPFSPLTLGVTGYYYLEASAPNFVSAASGLFMITSSATSCSGSCSGSTSDGPASVNVNVNNPAAGDLLSVVVGGYTYSCPDRFSPTGFYQTATSPVGIDLWESDGSLDPSQHSEVVSITIPKQLVRSDPKFLFLYEVCYASTQPFPGGTLVSSAESIPGFAGSTYVGLLRDCPFRNPGSAAPCVLSRTWNWRDGSVVITFLGAPGDFWGSA
ncbi:MAG: hypothetical protein ACLQT7_12380 [Candidatus Dormibacteria bacterium]